MASTFVCHGRIGSAIGDVAGNGFVAAFFILDAALREIVALRWQGGTVTLDLAGACKDDPGKTVVGGTFVCTVVGHFDPASNIAIWANAGFPPALLHGADRCELFRAEGPPLGIVPKMNFPKQQAPLIGRCGYLFPDGVTGARDDARRALGVAGVMALLWSAMRRGDRKRVCAESSASCAVARWPTTRPCR